MEIRDLAQAIRRERRRRRLSQAQLAERANVGVATIQRLEQGQQVRQSTVQDVLSALSLETLDGSTAAGENFFDSLIAAFIKAAERDKQLVTMILGLGQPLAMESDDGPEHQVVMDIRAIAELRPEFLESLRQFVGSWKASLPMPDHFEDDDD